MDRFEEIREAAKCRKFPRFNDEFMNQQENPEALELTLELAFKEGADWADKNPSFEMVDKIVDLFNEWFNNTDDFATDSVDYIMKKLNEKS